MNCEQATGLLGQYLDGELAPSVAGDVNVHLASCTPCRAELGALSDLAAELAAEPSTPVPEELWAAIEERLSDGSGVTVGAGSHTVAGRVNRRSWRRHVPLAIAASILLVAGLSLFGPLRVDFSARASAVDFSALLDALPVDAKKAFERFLVLYKAERSTLVEARRFAPDLNFALPEELPGGFRLASVYVLKFGDNPGVAAMYEREGDFLGAVFHPPVNRENYGPHSEYPCMVGDYEGHKVSVGQWRLVHLMEPSTCHCVLSRLDESADLPDIMSAIAPNLAAGATHHEHCD